MKKVIFLNNWDESPEKLLQRYSLQTPNNSGVWGQVKGVTSFDDADYYVIMDGVSQSLINKIDWSRTIFFQREPDSIRPHFMNHQFPDNIFFNGTYEHFYNVPTWWINIPFNELSKMRYPKKSKKISSVTSGKANSVNYSNRLRFLCDFAQKYPNIDVYGRGISHYVNECWKGELNYNGNCKFKGLVDYEYSIVLENTMLRNSWTEKPSDSILSWSFPIYSGATNFSEFFPEESFYNLDVENYNIDDIIDFINNPLTEIQIEALEESRNLLLHKWNLWPTLSRIIHDQ